MSFEARSTLTPPTSEPALKSLDPSHITRFTSATSPSPSQSDQDTCETSSLAELSSPSCNSINSVLPRSSHSLLDSATPLPPAAAASRNSTSSSMSEADGAVSLAPVSETEASLSTTVNGDHPNGMSLDSEASTEQSTDVDMAAASSDPVDTQAASAAVPATDSNAADSSSDHPQAEIPAFDNAPPAAVDAFPVPSDSATPANNKKRARRPTGLEETPAAGRALILTPEQAELKRKKLSKGYALVAVPTDGSVAAPAAADPLPVEDGKRPKRTRVKPEPMPALLSDAAKTNGHSTPRARTPSAKAAAAAAGVGGKRKAPSAAANVDLARTTLLRTKLDLLKQRLQQVLLDPSIVLRADELPAAMPVDASAFSTPAPANRRARPAVSSVPRTAAKTPATARAKSGHKPPIRPPAVDVTSPSTAQILPSPSAIVPVPLSSPYHGASTPSTPSSSAFPAPSPTVRVTARSNRTIKTPKHLEATALAPALSDAFGRCKDLLARFSRHKHAYPFVVPVDWEALNIPTYPQIIKNPMDLGTIRDRLDRNHYDSLDAFKADVDLVWQNAMTFNPPDHIVHNMASVLKQEFDEAYVRVVIGGLEKKRMKKKSPFGLFPLDMPATPDGAVTPSGASKTPRARSSATAALSEELAAMRQCMAQMQEQLRQATTNPPKSASRPRAQTTGPLTYQERAEIKEDIQRLPHDKLLKAVEIISISHPDAAKADGEDLEIDFDQLGTVCCRKLQKFIRSALYGRGRGGGGGRGRGRGRGGAHHSSYDPSPSPSLGYDELDPNLVDINTGYAPTERLGGLTTSASIEAAQAAAYAPPSDSDSDDSSDSDGEGGRKRRKYPQPGMGFAASAAMTAGLAPDSHKKKRGRPARPIVPSAAAAAGSNPSFGDPSMFSAAPIDLGHALSATAAATTNHSASEVKSVDVSAWSNLDDDDSAPSGAAAQPSPSSGGNLWADFKSMNEEQKQKERERAEHEERMRKERERIEAERRREAERHTQLEREAEERRRLAAAQSEAETRRQLEAERDRLRSAGEQVVVDTDRNVGTSAATLQASLEAELFGEDDA